MNTLFVGKNFIQVPQADSTNSMARELLPSHPPEGTIVITSDQRKGRGQTGNSWFSSPDKNLTFSLILYPGFLSLHHAFYLHKVVGCALHEVLKPLMPEADLQIKWPNDLLADRKKMAGILVENILEQDHLQSSVIGIGLNINQDRFPPHLKEKATSLFLSSGHMQPLQPILASILEKIEARYLELRSGKKNAIDDYYLHHLWGYQELISIRIGSEVQQRVMVGVDPSGRLALDMGGKLGFFGIKEIEFLL